MKLKTIYRWALLCLSMVVMPGMASAKTCIWTGGGTAGANGRLWSNSANWQDGNVPVSGDYVYVTNKTSVMSYCDISGLSLPHFELYTSGASVNMSGRITLTGYDNKLYYADGAGVWDYSSFELVEGSKVIYCGEVGIGWQRDEKFTGKGTVEVNVSRSFYYMKRSTEFEGTINILNAAAVYLGSNNADVGADKARINVYKGFNTDNGIHHLYGEYHFYKKAGITSQKMCYVMGDVYLHADNDNDIFQFTPYGRSYDSEGKQIDAGFVFNGYVYTHNDGKYAYLGFYTYGTSGTTGHNDSIITFNKGVDLGLKPVNVSKQNSATGMVMTVGGPMKTEADYFVRLFNGDRFYTTAPYVLPQKNLYMGAGDGVDCHGIVLDLKGNSQKIGSLLSYYNADINDYKITSTEGPATLNFERYGTNLQLPAIDGQASIYIRRSSNGRKVYTFPNGCKTSGTLTSESDSFNFGVNYCPNLGGIHLMAEAYAMINANTILNEAMEITLDDTDGGGLYVASGKVQRVQRVIYNNTDLPADTYCRPGAGISGATEADWMLGTANTWDGTIVIAEHDPVWIWTGLGDGTTLSDPLNWGAGKTPDFTNKSLTLDFHRATLESPVTLDQDIAVGKLVFSDEHAAKFIGKKSIILEGDVTLNAVFEGAASVVHNGTGTLTLTGESTSSGAIYANGGKVVLASTASWAGEIRIAEGAEVEFKTAPAHTCTLYIDGVLRIAEGIEAEVLGITIDGEAALSRKSYGSTESEADVKDDVHFAGAGMVKLGKAFHGSIINVR